MKITDYWILHHTDGHCLEKQVQEYIKQGWQPFGNLVVSFSDFGQVRDFYQPMVKYAE